MNANNVETATRCELWLESLKKGAEDVRKMFGVEISVDWRVNPQTEISDGWEGGKDNDNYDSNGAV